MQPDRGTADDSEQILQSWVVTEALRQLSTEHRAVLRCCLSCCGRHAAARSVVLPPWPRLDLVTLCRPRTEMRTRSIDAVRVGRLIRRYPCSIECMPQVRIRDAASFLGVSDDTVRRWIDQGDLTAHLDGAGRKVVDGHELALHARSHSSAVPDPLGTGSSARNRFVGLVTAIVVDKVMAQVELQCGPHRVVSLMSSEAVRDLGLELGSVAVAVVKSTTVIIETPGGLS